MCLLHLHRQSSFITCIYSHVHHTLLFTLHSPPNPVHTFSKLVSTQTVETKATATPTPQPGPRLPNTQGHPTPRTFPSDREHDTGPLHPCRPYTHTAPALHRLRFSPMLPSSIHHICPPASITSSQRLRTQRKEKAK